jgi:hypothetical protein
MMCELITTSFGKYMLDNDEQRRISHHDNNIRLPVGNCHFCQKNQCFGLSVSAVLYMFTVARLCIRLELFHP